ncbi:MAG: hypothetical protein U1E32_02530 [Rhodoglobus sp.]|nr:hypothetical protein [Rhodoglobus sp.]
MSDTFAPPPSDAPFVSGTPAPAPPSSPGWAAAATAIHGIQQIPRPILISLAPAGHPPLAIDLRDHQYVWATPLDQFPAAPADVVLGTYPLDPEDPGLAGDLQGVDPLLWLIGLHGFPGGRASWLRPGDKYRLKWLPDLDMLPATADQLRVVKTTVKSLMTVDKLASLAKVPLDEAQSVVNALSLMGALRRVEGKGGAPAQPMPTGAYDLPGRSRGRHVKRGG